MKSYVDPYLYHFIIVSPVHASQALRPLSLQDRTYRSRGAKALYIRVKNCVIMLEKNFTDRYIKTCRFISYLVPVLPPALA